MYYLAEDLQYVPPGIAQEKRIVCQGILNGTSNLIKYLKSSR